MRYIIIIVIILFSAQLGLAQKKTASKLIVIPTKKDTFEYFSVADTVYSQYTLPPTFTKPKNWRAADSERASNNLNSYGFPYAASYTFDDAITAIDTARDLLKIGSAKTWCVDHYQQAFPYLIQRLSDKRKIGLIPFADLIIWDRIGTGDLEFYGHGAGIEEDIFTIAGRASWILNEITGEKFAQVHGALTKEQAKEFKQKWINYINTLKK